ncbi:hypothetical protein [Ramlibacter sp.]|uniref:hypothetical protein n=1 Tax=Ramlibacter sp. TaxID=1917967 RepID=UPI002BC1DD32|nr:hypothetical protein [Ramlibacter sp.]HWI81390.1 hypothetical protein [Ramlibacter sp.]
MVDHLQQMGPPDPERETSPIIDDDEKEDIEPEGPGGYCRFNGVTFRIGDYVLSGDEVLHCEAPGLWVREGELRTDDLRRS